MRHGQAFPDDIEPTSTNFKLYVLEDQIGSSVVRLKTDASVIDIEEYYPFGDSSLRTFEKKRYRYIGKERDLESGLYYYGARYYAAWTCRFISVDPLAGKYAQLSPYNYSDNNPINDYDIDGMQNNNSDPSQSGGESNNQNTTSNSAYLWDSGGVPNNMSVTSGDYVHSAPIEASKQGATAEIHLSQVGSEMKNYSPPPEFDPTVAPSPPPGSDFHTEHPDRYKPGFFGSIEIIWKSVANYGPGPAKGMGMMGKSMLYDTPDQIKIALTQSNLKGERMFPNEVRDARVLSIAEITMASFGGLLKPKPNYTYRSLSTANSESLAKGAGVYGKNPQGIWSLDQHLTGGSGKGALLNDPWISTSTDYRIAKAFDSGNGMIRIDLNRLPSDIKTGIGSEFLPRSSHGYHYSVWQHEVSIYRHVPQKYIERVH